MARNTKKNVTLIVCRLCLVEVSTVVPIFTSKNVTETSSLQMKIMELANVQVYAGDGLPSNVCFNCSKLIESYHAFKVQIEKSDVILRHQLSSFQTDPLSVDSKLDTVIETNHEEIVKAETFFIKDEADVDEEHVESILHPSVELSTKSPVPSPAPPLPEDPPDNMEGDDNDEDDIDNDLGEVDDDVMDEDVDDDDDEEDDDDDDNVDDDIDPFGDEDAEPDSSSAGEKGTEFTKKSGTSTESEQTSNILFQSLTKGAKKTKSPKKSSVVPSATVTSASVNIPTTPSATVTSGSLSTDSLPIDSDPGPSTSKSEITESGESSSTVPESQVKWNETAIPRQEDNSAFLDFDMLTEQTILGTRCCEMCGFFCKTFVDYKKHISKSHKRGCDICNKSFTSVKSVNRHKRAVHSGMSDFHTCQFCNKIFKYNESLKLHMRILHLEGVKELEKSEPIENEVKCPICNDTFRNKNLLKNHIRTHLSNKKLHVCEICGKNTSDIKHHMMTHSTEIQSDLICKICGKVCNSKRNYKKHTKTHSNVRIHVCEICGSSFKTGTVLRNHLLIHNEERNFKCLVCEKTFKYKSVLNTHSRIHNGVEPYMCYTCGESFKWKNTYDKHLVTCVSKNVLNENIDD